MPNLRDYQLASIEALRQGIAAGHRSQLLCAPTGAGKSVMAVHLIEQALAKRSRTAFVVDRISLVDQISKMFDDYSIPHGVIQANHWRNRGYEPLQVISIATLARRDLSGSEPFQFLIWDECFIGDTTVMTPSGPTLIKLVRSGDLVYNAIGVGRVLATSARPLRNRKLVNVRLSNGTEIRCTADHPFISPSGQAIKAGKLVEGEIIVGFKEMPDLWEQLWAGATTSGEILGKASHLLAFLLKEIDEPNVLEGKPGQDVGNASTDWAQAKGTWWKRKDNAIRAARDIANTWRRLGSGVGNQDRGAMSGRNSESLHDRRSQSAQNDCNRTGRAQSLRTEGYRTRQSQGRILNVTRVVSVSVEECSGDTTVYNLHVSGHPSYFANRTLVHNCHIQSKAVQDFIAANPAMKVVGLTATPFSKGLGQTFGNIVNVTTPNKLIADGWLVPFKVYAAVKIDMAGAKVVAGEWEPTEIEKRSTSIIGDIVKEWQSKTTLHFGGPVKTIVFSATVAHGKELCRQFQAAGANFQQVSYLDGNNDQRRARIEEMRKPKSEIDGLVSCEALGRGLDIPDILAMIAARPYRKSLSSWVQQVGRVMRPFPGKQFALLLDHSGNFMRFRDDMAALFQDGVHNLDDCDLDAKVRKEPDEKIDTSVCKGCGYIMLPTDRVCPSCGMERPQRRNKTQHEAGEMVAMELGGKREKPRMAPWLEDKSHVQRQIWSYALHRKKGDEAGAEKFALAQYRNFYNEWPRRAFRNIDSEPCSFEVADLVRRNMLKYFRSKTA